MIRTKRAIVLLSGGMDSAVSLWWAKSKGWTPHALSFDYGQRHKKELQRAQELARLAKVDHRLLRIRLPWGGSSLTSFKETLPHHRLSRISSANLPSTYVPARNTVFLSFALSWADQLGASAIIIGANAVDYSGYPDCRPSYLKAVERVGRLGTRRGAVSHKKISVLAPLLTLSKSEIVKLGRKLKVPFDLTWSCYQGGRKPCGLCDACQLRNKGFREALAW